MTTTNNKDIIEKAYASFAVGDVPVPLAAFADDIEWTEPDEYPIAGTFVGPQAVLEGVFMRLGEIGDPFVVVPERFFADGNTVVALGNLAWKHKDTGVPASLKMAHVWTFRDGKATTFQQRHGHHQGERAELNRSCAETTAWPDHESRALTENARPE